MSSKPVLYYMTISPPSRAVMLVAAALNVELELKILNVVTEENKTPEYLAVNLKFYTVCCEKYSLFILSN